MAELKTMTAAAGDLEKRLTSLNALRFAGGASIQSLASVAAPKFQWDEGLRQTDSFVKNLQRGKMELNGIKDLWDKIAVQSRTIAENQTRLSNAAVRNLGNGQQQMYLPSVSDINNQGRAMEIANRQIGIQAQMLKTASTELQNWGKNTQWAGRQLMVGFTIPFAAAAAAAGVYAYQIDKSITQITKVYDGAQSEVKNLALATSQEVTHTMGQTAKSTLDVMASLAAVGKTGKDLQDATKEVQRLSTLGDMDQQTSLKSYIALQATFKMSVKETGEAINYMNAIENATSLSMQDFADAIPRAAAPVAQLGGTLQDLGVVLVALKERGVDAAEGSNAIKTLMNRLISPGKDVQKVFQELTHRDLGDFIKSTRGELMPTMQGLADIIMNGNLSMLQQQELIGKLGGAYQLTRLTAILDGLASKSEQVQKALDVNAGGPTKWAASAQKELEAITTSVSGKFRIAIQDFKTNFQQFGEVAIKMATIIVNTVGGVFNAFNGVPEWFKGLVLVLGGLTAVAGPITMVVGLAANLIGTVGKGLATLQGLGSRYKALTIEQKANEIATQGATNKFKSEADMVQVLAFQLGKLEQAYMQTAAAAQKTALATNVGSANSTAASAKANEVAQAEKMAYLMAAQQNLLNDPSKVARLRNTGPDATAAQRLSGAAAGPTWKPGDLVFVNKEAELQYQKMAAEIKAQENLLTTAITHRAAAVKEALTLEAQMMAVGLKELAAQQATAMTAQAGVLTTPTSLSLNGTDYKQNAKGRWTNANTGRFVSSDENNAIKEGFAQVTAAAGTTEQAVNKTTLAQKVFNQNTLLGASAVTMMAGSLTSSGSAWSYWLNGISITTGLIGAFAPALSGLKDKIAKSKMLEGFMDGSSAFKTKFMGFMTELGTGAKGLLGAVGSAVFSGWGLALIGVGVAAYATYRILTESGRAQVAHMDRLVSTTDGWMKTLGQAKVEWGQIKDATGQTADNMSAMVSKLRTNNKDLVEETQKQSGAGLDTVLRGEVYRLQGQGLGKEDIMKSMETLLNAAGKTKDEISAALSNIRISFDLSNGLSDVDKFLGDIKSRVNDAQVFGGVFQGMPGMGDDPTQQTGRGRKGTDYTAQLIYDRLASLGETEKKIVGDQIADVMNAGFNDGFNKLKTKYGDQIKGDWQQAASDLLTFDSKSGWTPKINMTADGPQDPTQAQKDLGVLLNANRDTAMKLADLLNTPGDHTKIQNFGDVLKYIGSESQSAADTQKEYDAAVKKAEASTGSMTEAQKKALASAFAQKRGLDAVKLANGEYAASHKVATDSVYENLKALEAYRIALQRTNDEQSNFNGMKSGNNDFFGSMSSGDQSGFGVMGGDATSQGKSMVDAKKQIYSNTMNTAYDLATIQADQQYKARMDGITAYYQGIKDRLNDQMKGLDQSWTDRMQKFSDDWKDRMDATKKSYDDRKKAIEDDAKAQVKAIDDQVKSIQDQEDAAKELDDQRKKMFDAEVKRLERLNELANTNIDYNRALSNGNLDEAARVMNNSERTQISWGAEDVQTAADERAAARGKATKAQIDALNASKDIISEQKQAKLDALAEEEDAVTKSLEKQQEAEKRSLEIQKQNEKDRLQTRIDGLAKEEAAVQETERRKQELDRKTLEIELATLKAFVPMNEQQLWDHIGRVQGAYDNHGVSLQFKGTQWGQIVGTALSSNVENARVQMTNNAAWEQSGAQMGDAISRGAFGLSLGEFMNMVITGQVPPGWRGASQGPGSHTQAFMDMHYRHGGGEVNTSFGNRLGRGGALHADEIPTVLQHGEYVINKGAAEKLGPGYLEAINSGRVPAFGVGGAEVGFAGIAGGIAATVMRSMITSLFLGSKKQQDDAAQNGGFAGIAQKAGVYGGVSLGSEELRNASIIASVGKSMGASARDIMISFMTAMQESRLQNLNYGDRDSVGLFQQRPSQGWGSVAQIMNPEYASRKFFEGLLRVGNRDSMPPTLAAQAVQRSGFPYAYAKWQPMAEQLLGAGLGAIDPNSVKGFGLFGRIIQAFSNSGGSGRYMKPTEGPITSEYGWRTDPFTGARSLHDGIDIGAANGTPIYATDSGRVIQAGWNNGGFGNWTLIDHGNGLISGYAHQSRIGVGAGQNVARGQVIGNVGSTGRSTGAHLHFQMGPGPGNFQNPRNWVPSLNVGGTINYDNVLANLHRGETVLTSPLSAQLERGINNLDSGAKNEYNYNININGSGLSQNELETVITNVIETQKMRDMKRTGKMR